MPTLGVSHHSGAVTGAMRLGIPPRLEDIIIACLTTPAGDGWERPTPHLAASRVLRAAEWAHAEMRHGQGLRSLWHAAAWLRLHRSLLDYAVSRIASDAAGGW